MSLDHLLSKILAGGLTAGLFLLWWPRHFPAEGLEGLILRGLLWTLVFELMFVAFAPVEDMLIGGVKRRMQARRVAVRSLLPIPSTPARVRTGGVVALACISLVAPLALLSDVAKNPLRPEEPKTKVVRQVIVQKPVVKREVVVKRVVETPPATPVRPDAGLTAPAGGVAPARTTDAAKTPKKRSATRAPETKTEAPAESDATTTPAEAPKTSSTATTTTAEPEPATAPAATTPEP